MKIMVDRQHRVVCHTTLRLPISRRQAWGQLRDFHRYACHDLFHVRLAPTTATFGQGMRFTLTHRFLGITTQRHVRILCWREEEGYAFSDLSRRGPRHGFPHTFSYDLADGPTPDQCVLDITIRGRWTLAALPRAAIRLWLFWMFAKLVASVERDLLAFAVVTREARGRGSNRPATGGCSCGLARDIVD